MVGPFQSDARDPTRGTGLAPRGIPGGRGQGRTVGCGSVPRMAQTESRTIEVNIHGLLQDWGLQWGLPDLARSVRVEWGRRFRRSLGRVHLDRRVVRVAVELAIAPTEVLREVICHEVAHLAARDLNG